MEIQSRLSIEKCRELLVNSKNISDETITSQRNRLYSLARFLVEKFEQLTTFITSFRTIDVKARIVK